MSWYDLAWIGATFRPIDEWPGPLSQQRRTSPFTASLTQTLQLLARELEQLGATRIVVQIAVTDADLRVDGFPKAYAKPAHPGVVLAFESRHGPLKFAVDTFTSWQDNLRAIALGMEALRKVDRYGVTNRGEQYTGWRALPRSTDAADGIATREQAEALISDYGGLTAAIKATHPDAGGDPDEFRKVMRAKELIA